MSSTRSAGGQQLTGLRADRGDPVHDDLGAAAGYTGDGEIAAYLCPSVTDWDLGDQYGLRVGVEDADRGDRLGRFDQALVDGERAHPGGDVAAVAAVTHDGPVNFDLRECVVDVGVVAV